MKIKNIVGIEKINQISNKNEIEKKIFNLLNNYQDRNPLKIPKNGIVFIKPNICLVKGYETGTTVDPYVVECMVKWLNQEYDIKKIIIGEADATELNIDLAFKALEWENIFSKYPNVQLLNISKDEMVDVHLNGIYFKSLKMSKSYMQSDYLISVAKLKTHTMTGITCNLKNIYGANPIKFKAQYHKKLDDVICDLNKVRIPDLCLVDGIIGMEGEGPTCGVPKPCGILVIGNNPVAVDHLCAKIMGFNPKTISHLRLAAKENLGDFSYDLIDDKFKNTEIKFDFIPFSKKVIQKGYNNFKVLKKLHIRNPIIEKT